MKPKISLNPNIYSIAILGIVLGSSVLVSSCTSCTREEEKTVQNKPKTEIEAKPEKDLTPGERVKLEEHRYVDKYLTGKFVSDPNEFYFPEIKQNSPGGEITDAKKRAEKFKTLQDGLKYKDLSIGFGMVPEVGGRVLIHYTGWLANGAKFDSSLDRKMPVKFKFGKGEVIRGLDEGVTGMKVGGVRKLVVPPELAYGDKGNSKLGVPPGETITLVIKLLSGGR